MARRYETVLDFGETYPGRPTHYLCIARIESPMISTCRLVTSKVTPRRAVFGRFFFAFASLRSVQVVLYPYTSSYINNIIIIYLGRWWFFSLPRAPPALSHVGPRVATSWYRGSVPAGHVLCIVVFIYAYSIYLRHA